MFSEFAILSDPEQISSFVTYQRDGATLPNEEMSAKVAALDSAWKSIGCDIVSPFMTMALIPLACLPTRADSEIL